MSWTDEQTAFLVEFYLKSESIKTAKLLDDFWWSYESYFHIISFVNTTLTIHWVLEKLNEVIN